MLFFCLFVCFFFFFFFVWYCLCLYIFCIIFSLKCHDWLLKAFPNCHCVCHQTTNMYAPISTTGGSHHGSSVFIRFGYLVVNSLTHNPPKSLDYFLLTKNDRPCRLDQYNVHYITSWEV